MARDLDQHKLREHLLRRAQLPVDRSVLAFISLDGCHGCEMQQPIVHEFSEAHPNVGVVKLDLATNSNLPWPVTMTPSFVWLPLGGEMVVGDGAVFYTAMELAKWCGIAPPRPIPRTPVQVAGAAPSAPPRRTGSKAPAKKKAKTTKKTRKKPAPARDSKDPPT